MEKLISKTVLSSYFIKMDKIIKEFDYKFNAK